MAVMIDIFKVFVLSNFVVDVLCQYPAGHMKQFGHHRPPSVPVDEVTKDNLPRPEEFYEKYVKQNKPVLFRNVLTESRAYQLWTDEYIKTNFGDMEVRLEGKKEKLHMPPVGETYLGRDNLRHFVDTYHEPDNNVYIVSDLPSTMYHDMGVISSFGACGEMSRRIVEVDMWWSGGGSSSIIHKDAYNQLNCLLNGTKFWKLIAYEYEKDIYKHPEDEREIGGFSDVNSEEVDLIRYPKVKNVEWSNITVYAGDCLFLPKSYYHQVKSQGTNNKAVSLLFSRFGDRNSLDFSDCTEDTDYKEMKSLADFKVHWKWPGKGKMVMGSADLEEGVRNSLLQYAEEAEESNQKFDVKLLKMVLEENQGVGADGTDPQQLFQEMDGDGDGIITKADVKAMTQEGLLNVANQMERYEPSNTYEFEYSVMPFEKVWVLVKVCLDQHKILTKDRWLKFYRRAGGSNLCGEEIFNRLAGDKTEINNAEVTEKMIYDALENWVTYFAEQYSQLKTPPKDFSKRRQWYRPGLSWLAEDNMVQIKSKEEDDSEGIARKAEL